MTSRASTNPHFLNPDRPAYELAKIFRKLPSYLSEDCCDQDAIDLAKAAELHIDNAMTNVLHGMEAVASLIYYVSVDAPDALGQDIAHVGWLIKHLSVEAQMLVHRQKEFSDFIARTDALKAKKGART